MPFMSQIAHDQCVIKFDRALRESLWIREKAGFDLADCERAHPPFQGAQQQSIQPIAPARHGVAETSTFKKRRSLSQRTEARTGRQRLSLISLDSHGNRAIKRTHFQLDMAAEVQHGELRRVMFTWKNAPAGHSVEQRAGIPSRDEDAFALDAGRIGPLNSEAVRRILAGDAENARQTSGTNALEADQADADQCMSVVQLGPEWTRHAALHGFGLGSKIDQEPSFDDALDYRDTHATRSAAFRLQNAAHTARSRQS
jgi:hypothetical protein